MRLYLDDDSASSRLVRLLRQDGHDVQIPADVNLSGGDDAMHLTQCISDGRTLLTGNYRDFENLHNLIMHAGGKHSGILVVRKDNDPRRDMTTSQIVSAVAKLVLSGTEIETQFNILNYWR